MRMRRLVNRLTLDLEQAAPTIEGRSPSFIGVGMPSSGTRWLHDQLAGHRDVWVPCQKELHFFDRGMRFVSAQKRLHRLLHFFTTRHKLLNLLRNPTARLGLHSIDDTQIHFLAEYLLNGNTPHWTRIERQTQPARDRPGSLESLIDNPGLGPSDFEHYRRLFGYHDQPACGEITPAYSYLSTDYIAEIAGAFPETRFILIVRDPIERQLSGWKKRIRKGRADPPPLDATTAASTPTTTEPALDTTTADPCMIADRWLAGVGEQRLLVARFEDIVERPDAVRTRLAAYLNLPSGSRGFRIPANYNRKRGKSAQARITPESEARMRERLNSRLQDAQRRYTERFGE